MTVLYLSGIEPGIKYKELVPGWILLAPVTEAEVVETVSSLLRRLSWARDSLLHNDLSAVLDSSTPVTEVEPFPPCSASLRCCFPFFSFRVSLSEISPFSNREEYGGKECRGLYRAFPEEAEVLFREHRVGEVSDLAIVV